jgi:hypothetical protein
MTIDRITKLVVLASMSVAVVLEAALMQGGWRPILPVTIAVLLIAFIGGLRFPKAAAAPILVCAYLFPAIVAVLNGQFEIGYMTVWVAALLGVISSQSLRGGWAVPSPWRLPLALWALTVSLVWPVVAWREADFTLMTLDLPRLSVTGPPGVPPLLAIVWTLNVTLVLGVGILWFDWLYAVFDGAEHSFRTIVLGSLAASWTITTAVAVYQMLVDVTFMNSGRYGFLQRASGLMFDANPFGVIAALGVPAAAAVALQASGRGSAAVLVSGVTLSWLGLWASGSRTALATGAIATLFVLYYWWDRMARARPTRQWLIPAILVAAVLVAAPILLQRVSDVGPWRRLIDSLPGLSLAELWNRNGYGLNAWRMIEEFPGFGVGVGSFHHLVLDYSRLPGGGGSIPIDNAQNWYRHQLAEFGLVGSLGWIAWTLLFASFVLRPSRSSQTRSAAGAVRGGLIAIALISTLGMPTQNIAVTLTFWTLAFWYAQLAGWASSSTPAHVPVASGENRANAGLVSPSNTGASSAAWPAVWAVAILSVAGTVYSARHELRVPERAARFGWPYSYGWYGPETDANGEFRWAGRHAVAVIEATKPWMKLTVSVNHADIARRPVNVRVWRDTEEVLATTLLSPLPITEYVAVRDGHPRVVLETWVDRVVRPADFGVPDSRELGLMVRWDWADAPTPRALLSGDEPRTARR